MTDSVFPVAIVGAGASGMMAAIAASRARPQPVLLIEKEARVGRKLLATGNGRCNLLNLRLSKSRYHGSGAHVAHALLERHSPGELLKIFQSLGLCCREESEGRVYPYSGQAASVLDVLRYGCARSQVTIVNNAAIARIERSADGFRLMSTDGAVLLCKRLILAGGGRASPSLGSDGSLYSLLSSLGHTITPTYPAIVPLTLPKEPIRGLKGVRAQVHLRLWVDGKHAHQEEGEALFTEYGISGIAAMQLGRHVQIARAKGRQTVLSIGLVPADMAGHLLPERVSLLEGEPMETFFTGWLHPRVALCLLREAGISGQAPICQSSAAPLLPLLSDWRVPVTGTLDFSHAQVTAGGALLSEFSPQTLESLLVPGLYACGELLDVDGDCGGYNLMWAWVSGLVAGRAAAASR